MTGDCPCCGLKADYIPGGEVAHRAWNPRKPNAFYQCGTEVSYDIQAGPIYCGQKATLIADGKGGIIAVCDRHKECILDILIEGEK